MTQSINSITYLVRDYDEAIQFFVNKLHFDLIEDSQAGNNKRWALVRPKGANTSSRLLAKAATPEQEKFIGNQTGGRVFLFLHSDDFWRDYHDMKSAV